MLNIGKGTTFSDCIEFIGKNLPIRANKITYSGIPFYTPRHRPHFLHPGITYALEEAVVVATVKLVLHVVTVGSDAFFPVVKMIIRAVQWSAEAEGVAVFEADARGEVASFKQGLGNDNVGVLHVVELQGLCEVGDGERWHKIDALGYGDARLEVVDVTAQAGDEHLWVDAAPILAYKDMVNVFLCSLFGHLTFRPKRITRT